MKLHIGSFTASIFISIGLFCTELQVSLAADVFTGDLKRSGKMRVVVDAMNGCRDDIWICIITGEKQLVGKTGEGCRRLTQLSQAGWSNEIMRGRGHTAIHLGIYAFTDILLRHHELINAHYENCMVIHWKPHTSGDKKGRCGMGDSSFRCAVEKR